MNNLNHHKKITDKDKEQLKEYYESKIHEFSTLKYQDIEKKYSMHSQVYLKLEKARSYLKLEYIKQNPFFHIKTAIDYFNEVLESLEIDLHIAREALLGISQAYYLKNICKIEKVKKYPNTCSNVYIAEYFYQYYKYYNKANSISTLIMINSLIEQNNLVKTNIARELLIELKTNVLNSNKMKVHVFIKNKEKDSFNDRIIESLIEKIENKLNSILDCSTDKVTCDKLGEENEKN